MINDYLKLIIAGTACILTFFVVRRVFRKELRLGPPNLLAALVSGLALVGLVGSADGVVGALLIPYEALALTIALLFLLFGFSPLGRRRSHDARPPDEVDGKNSSDAWNKAARKQEWENSLSVLGTHEQGESPVHPSPRRTTGASLTSRRIRLVSARQSEWVYKVDNLVNLDETIRQ